MAAANLSLPHAQVQHLMVSNVQAGGEGWPWVDGHAADVCAGAGRATPPSSTYFDPATPFANDAHPPGPAAPSVLHLCQGYRAGGQHYAKRGVPRAAPNINHSEEMFGTTPAHI